MFIALLYLLPLLLPLTRAQCLLPAKATNLALRYFQAFQTDSEGAATGAALIPTAFAPNFTYYDEGASMGVFGPVYHNRSELTAAIESSGYTGNLVTDVTYDLLYVFVGCQDVATRWRSRSRASNGTAVKVPVGTEVTYKGNDYLSVDLTTRLIYNATSSSDLLNYYKALGDDILAS